jgi:hypothetical protein
VGILSLTLLLHRQVNNSAPSSHALRNPTRPAQESRPCKGNESGASKATKALEAAITKNKKIEYEATIDEIFVERNKKIAELAARFNKDASEVHATVCCVTQFKAGRKPTLRNGVAHQCSLDLQEQGMFRSSLSWCTHNCDLLPGITKPMTELYAELEAELSNGTFTYKSIDKVEQKRLIDQVLEARHLARRGPRATMKAAQVDGRFTAKCIGDEVFLLHSSHSGSCINADTAFGPFRAHRNSCVRVLRVRACRRPFALALRRLGRRP